MKEQVPVFPFSKNIKQKTVENKTETETVPTPNKQKHKQTSDMVRKV